jgi:hypothetical protein
VRWAELPDVTSVPVDVSLSLLDLVHTRWVAILRSMPDAAFQRRYIHPETGQHDLNYLVAMYAWHGRHQTAHITELRRARGW